VQTGIFKAVRYITGLDIQDRVESAMSWLIKESPSKLLGAADAGLSKIACDYDGSVMCRRRNPDKTLLQIVISNVLYALLAVVGLRFVGLGFLSYAVLLGFVALFIPITFKRAYDMPYGCSISLSPVLPVCIAEDLRNMTYFLLPRHLPWPTPLVNVHNRTIVQQRTLGGETTSIYYIDTTDVFDCRDIGFTDGTRVIIYGLDYLVPEWRSYITSISTSMLFGIDAIKTTDFFADREIHGHLYEQCAALNAISVIPILLVGALVLVFGVAVLHCVLLFVRNMLFAARAVYMTFATAYIMIRDAP
jgi:hypothetical protein